MNEKGLRGVGRRRVLLLATLALTAALVLLVLPVASASAGLIGQEANCAQNQYAGSLPGTVHDLLGMTPNAGVTLDKPQLPLFANVQAKLGCEWDVKLALALKGSVNLPLLSLNVKWDNQGLSVPSLLGTH